MHTRTDFTMTAEYKCLLPFSNPPRMVSSRTRCRRRPSPEPQYPLCHAQIHLVHRSHGFSINSMPAPIYRSAVSAHRPMCHCNWFDRGRRSFGNNSHLKSFCGCNKFVRVYFRHGDQSHPTDSMSFPDNHWPLCVFANGFWLWSRATMRSQCTSELTISRWGTFLAKLESITFETHLNSFHSTLNELSGLPARICGPVISFLSQDNFFSVSSVAGAWTPNAHNYHRMIYVLYTMIHGM